MNSSIKSTCLLFETIKIQDRQLHNLRYHNRRMNASRCKLFGCTNELQLEEFISIPDKLNYDLFKCQVVYNELIAQVKFEPYKPRIIKTLQLVQADSIHTSISFLTEAVLINCSKQRWLTMFL